jgi:hypothetical protein
LNRERDSTLSPAALKAEEARLARYFKSISKHRAALKFVLDESFGGELDAFEWRRAFDSSDPSDTTRTVVITGSYSAIVNAYVEILKASASSRMTGLVPHRRPHAEQVLAAVQSDGGLTAEQAGLLSDSYVLEGRLEHASPDVGADEVREAVERLLGGLPGLIESALAWLESHGTSFAAVEA